MSCPKCSMKLVPVCERLDVLPLAAPSASLLSWAARRLAEGSVQRSAREGREAPGPPGPLGIKGATTMARSKRRSTTCFTASSRADAAARRLSLDKSCPSREARGASIAQADLFRPDCPTPVFDRPHRLEASTSELFASIDPRQERARRFRPRQPIASGLLGGRRSGLRKPSRTGRRVWLRTPLADGRGAARRQHEAGERPHLNNELSAPGADIARRRRARRHRCRRRAGEAQGDGRSGPSHGVEDGRAFPSVMRRAQLEHLERSPSGSGSNNAAARQNLQAMEYVRCSQRRRDGRAST